MAKRKKKDKGGGAIIFVVIFIIVATPIILLFGFLYYYSKTLEYFEKIKGTISDFWLTDDEKKIFKDLGERYFQIQKKLDEIIKEVQKHNIAINKDGSISKRSKLGKKLRAIVDELEPEKYELEEKLSELMNLPQKRWQEFNKTMRLYYTFKNSLSVWILSVICTGIYLKKWPWEIFKSYYKLALLPWREPHWQTGEFESLLIITVITIIGFIFFLYRNWNAGLNHSPIPPEVDFGNIDKY